MPDISDLIGTWKLIETRATDGQGNALPPPYGGPELRIGTVTFDAGGRMAAVLCQGVVGPDEKREYYSYCGHFTFDGKTLVTRVDATSDPARMGSDQVRDVTMEGGRMILRPPPRPWRSVMQHRELVWQKLG